MMPTKTTKNVRTPLIPETLVSGMGGFFIFLKIHVGGVYARNNKYLHFICHMVLFSCQYEQSDQTSFGSWKHGRHRTHGGMDAFVSSRYPRMIYAHQYTNALTSELFREISMYE